MSKIDKKFYESELERLQLELVKFQYWIKNQGLKVCIIFEGRDAAGKGGTIKRIHAPLNPRGARVVALSKPSSTEQTQWYFQRYIQHLPSAGEIVIFDRSWYNRAGVERVMGFCTDDEYHEFMRACPDFERMLVRSGTILIKYWITVDEDVQEERFRERALNPAKRWKLSDIDIASWNKWSEYSRAKDEMMRITDIPEAPWWNVDMNDKKKGHLNCISHLLSQISYEDVIPGPIELGNRKIDNSYERPPKNRIRWVKEKY
ncbi:polyphosphate kinase 2 [Candidatus Kapaibacterium sp.]